MCKRKVTAYISVGSNIDPEENIEKALKLLSRKVIIRKRSEFFRTKAINRPEQDDYLNGILQIETSLSPHIIKNNILNRIETTLGRKKSKDKFAPRTIDLDILLYGDICLDEDGLKIPDPDIYERWFLKKCLLEIDPEIIMPDTGKKLASYERPELWRKEYVDLKGIDMNFRTECPHSVLFFRDVLKNHKTNGQKILDVGCGKGRIGVHLAEAGFDVTGFDFVKAAVDEFQELASEKGLKNVTVFTHNMKEIWPFEKNNFNHIFAITVLDNCISGADFENVANEIRRVIKTDGLLVTEFYTPNDGYYGKGKSSIFFDQNNNLSFRLFTLKEMSELLKSSFKLIAERIFHFQSIKYGKTYQRESQVAIFRAV